MIEVDKIEKLSFPEIDFKFKNSGRSAAVLWQFAVCVTAAEVIQTPDLTFSYLVDDDLYKPRLDHHSSLSIVARNCGWGPANDCSVVCSDPVIGELFPEKKTRIAGDIGTGESLMLRLGPEDIDQTQFRILHSTLREKTQRNVVEQRNERQGAWYLSKADGYHRYYEEFMEIGDNSIAVIPLKRLMVSWSCGDVLGRACSGSDAVFQPDYGELYVSLEGFIFVKEQLVAKYLQSDIKYCVILDPEKGPQERVYPISRTIPASEAERFHIIVGATKSCRLNLKFKFWMDKQHVVESKNFDIEIWRPLNAHVPYEDGEEITEKTLAGDVKSFQWGKKGLAEFPFSDPQE